MKTNYVVKAAFGLMLGSLLMSTSAFADGLVKCTWADAVDGPHTVIKGKQTTLKAVVLDPSAVSYSWNFGDGSSSGIMAIGNPYVVEATHNYAVGSTTGKPYTATLTVYNAGGAVVGTDSYNVLVYNAANTTRLKKIAIENGLWYLHTQFERYTTSPEHGSAPAGFITNDYAETNPMNAQTFVDQGFLATGSAENPYTDDVQRMINYITENLAIMSLADKDGGDAENRTAGPIGMKDGLGVYMAANCDTEYGYGPSLKLIATAGYGPNDRPVAYNNDLNFSNGAVTNLTQWTYYQIAQQMVDWISWAQLNTCANDYNNYDWNTGTYIPAKKNCAGTKTVNWSYDYNTGAWTEVTVPLTVSASSFGGFPFFTQGWGVVDPTTGDETYGDGSFGDIAITYWTMAGVQAAKQKLGVTFPNSLKPNVKTFVLANLDSAGVAKFGAARHIKSMGRAGMALSLMQMVGMASNDPAVSAQVNFISNSWLYDNYSHGQSYNNVNENCSGEGVYYVGTPVAAGDPNCYTHFTLGTGLAGYWDQDPSNPSDPNARIFIDTVNYDKVNLLTLRTVTEGLKVLNLLVPGQDYVTTYTDLLINNQRPNGAWDDQDWGNGSTVGTGWALSALQKL